MGVEEGLKPTAEGCRRVSSVLTSAPTSVGFDRIASLEERSVESFAAQASLYMSHHDPRLRDRVVRDQVLKRAAPRGHEVLPERVGVGQIVPRRGSAWPEGQRCRVHVSDIEAVRAEQRHRHVPVRRRVDSVGVATGFDVDLDFD